MNKKTIILGNGFIASHFNYNIISDRISTIDDVVKIINTHKPDTIINCIGYCGNPNIDACEDNKDKTLHSNTIVPAFIAQATSSHDIKFINIGSGCIFSGRSPNLKSSSTNSGVDAGWKEKDFANPQSYYSNTKYATDLILSKYQNTCTLRIRMPISDKKSDRNFITKISKYENLIDIRNSMTIVSDLVRCVDWVIENDKSGIYHVTNPGLLSATSVMEEYKNYKPEHKYNVISEQELNKITKAKRSNCILNSDKLKNEGFQMQNAFVGMKHCMKKYFKN